MEQYFYLVWSLTFFVIWIILFLHRKDLRKEMLFISLLFGLGGIISEKTYLIDWWSPVTITRTKIGLEDFIIGFAIGGVAAVIYEEIYKRHLKKKRPHRQKAIEPFLFLLSFGLCYLTLFYFLRVSSFYSSVLTYSAFTFYLLFRRKDLANDSFYSGIFMMIIGVGIYFLLFALYPTYIQRFWYLPSHWYANLFFGIPAGEYIWYFLTGAFVGPLYEFISESKLTEG